VGTARHYYLLNRLAADQRTEFAVRDVWKGKQEAEPGTALPTSFPSYAALSAIGYTTKEDLDGADADELVETVGLSQSEAAAVMAAVATL